jgi:Helix-turn-helix domain
MRSVDEWPDLLTVEEAAEVLRIGRTKAYDLAKEWRATDGASGLPVVDLGNVLRVSRHALERIVGGPLSCPAAPEAPKPAVDNVDAAEPDDAPPAPRPRRRTRARHCDEQLDLFGPPTRS